MALTGGTYTKAVLDRVFPLDLGWYRNWIDRDVLAHQLYAIGYITRSPCIVNVAYSALCPARHSFRLPHTYNNARPGYRAPQNWIHFSKIDNPRVSSLACSASMVQRSTFNQWLLYASSLKVKGGRRIEQRKTGGSFAWLVLVRA